MLETVAVGLGLVLSFLAAPAVNAADQPAALPPLQVVLLIDESGSLSPEDVAKEKEAARTIAFSVLAPGSEVSVAGFGSSNGPGQSAVRVVCPATVLDAQQKRESLATCISGLHRRAPEEGDDTDHVAALQQALTIVQSGGPEKKIVFLLTDGKLDVSNSPSYGDTPERRNSAAAVKVQEVLADLDGAGAQVWPLGFGVIDDNALRGFAKGTSCTPAAPNPFAQVAPTSAELEKAIAEAFSSASCVKYGPTDTGDVPKGGTAELTVDIPAVASDASIVVYKRDPRVQVEYRAPKATAPAPVTGGTRFEFAGQTTETESLRITDPEPGRWTISLSSAEVPAEDVAATVAYQAAVKAFLTASPPQPAAGQTVDVDMQIWARGGAVTNPEVLQGLTFVTTLTGRSGFPPEQVTLTDPDQDGTFVGQLTVPDDAAGSLTFTGEVSGVGIGGDTRVLSTQVQGASAQLQGQILFDSNRATVTPGGTVAGTVSVTNTSGEGARLRLEIADPTPGTVLSVDPPVVSAAAGTSMMPFTLRFGADSEIGGSAATLRLVDAANPRVVVAERLFSTEVALEPGILEKLFLLWVALAVLLVGVAVFLLLRLRSRNEASKVRGLKVQLLQGGFATSELEPRSPNAKVFRFVLHNDFTGLQLQHAGPGEANAYEVRRVGPNVSLTPSGQRPPVLSPGERREVGPDLAVGVLDERGMAPSGPTDGVPDFATSSFGAASFGGPPSAPSPDPFTSSYGDPFAGSAAPAGPSAPAAPPDDPFPSSYGDPNAGSAPRDAATAPYPTSRVTGADDDPFGDDPFGGERSDGSSRRGSAASPAPTSGDTARNPYDPFA